MYGPNKGGAEHSSDQKCVHCLDQRTCIDTKMDGGLTRRLNHTELSIDSNPLATRKPQPKHVFSVGHASSANH